MSKYIRTVLIQITGYGWMVLLVGIGVLGWVAYSQYRASDDHAFTSRDKLQSLSGKVMSASEVTVTSKRRRGGSQVNNRYYEISVKPETGEAQNLRLDFSIGKKQVESVIDERITALFDANDGHIVYDLQMNGKPVLTYDTTKARLQAQAESAVNAINDLASIGGCILMILIGGGAMFWNRKLRHRQTEADTALPGAI